MNNGGQIQMAVPTMTPVVKKIIIFTVAVWIVGQIILEKYFGLPFTVYFSLIPLNVVRDFYLWQPLTFNFLHSDNWMHIVMNMLMLWWLGSELEIRWGSKFFLFYYLLSGIGAGIIYTIGMWIYMLITGYSQGLEIPVVGASGAVFGIMLAYGILFGERVIYFMMIFPMKARHFLIVLGAIEVIVLLNSGVVGSGVANLAHIGGLISGYLTLLGWTKFKQKAWKTKLTKRGRNLRLVVDNDDKKNGPKYWN